MGKFIDTTRYADQPRMVVLAVSLFKCLSRESSVGNSLAAGKRLIAERRLPVPGKDQLRAIQELDFMQESTSQVGASSTALKRFAPSKLASDRPAWLKFVPLRSAP